MSLLKYLLLLLVLLCAIPLGFLLAKLTKEELKQGRKAFKAIIIISFVIAAILFFLPISLDNKIFIIASMFFLMILALISLTQSYRRK